MDDREGSIASSTDFYGSDKESDTPDEGERDGTGGAGENGSHAIKRKADDLESAHDKRPRLASPTAPSPPELPSCAGLSPAIWQHIFLFCPLKSLGRLLQVNRSFHSYLTRVCALPTVKPHAGFLRLLKSESIWASARNLHPTKPPKPLPGLSEQRMWQLIGRTTCQFCDKVSSFVSGDKIWQQGPGADGVRIIWPFAIKSCGPCLVDRCLANSKLLFSKVSAASEALPFTFITSDKHYIPAHHLQTATTPAGVEIVKYYYNPDVEELTAELEHALSLGQAAAEEWKKGLETRGKERMKTAENWERWEVRWRCHQKTSTSEAQMTPPPASNSSQSTKTPVRRLMSPLIYAPIPTRKSSPLKTLADDTASLPVSVKMQMPDPRLIVTAPIAHQPHPRPPTSGVPSSFTPRAERNLQDANEAKASRKLDIERRCQLLDPPIPPNVLRHMDSFKAAVQISQPMNDSAWEMLAPRLRAQFSTAQQAEAEHVSRMASITTRAADRRQQDASLKEVKEVLDREWEEAQRPVRARLEAIADDFINNDWDKGDAVTFESSPKFAVDLFRHVRRKFYAEFAESEDQPPSHPSDGSGSDPNRPKLVLENMKWVYDNKLKPITEQYRKELFLCYGSGCENNTRFYGFEGVIQHFGAKHTNAFSVGNVVVAWREAEWPEETPFHPDPLSVKHSYHSGSNMANQGHSGFGSYYGGYSRAETSTPQMQPQIPHASPGPYGYGGYNGPFAPPQVPPGFDFSHAYGNPADAYAYPTVGQPGFGPHAGLPGYAASPAITNAAVVRHADHSRGNSGEGESRTSSYDKQVSTVIGMAKELWKQTSGIKDFPSSLRVYVLLHRIISKFQIEFNHEPNLSHIIDAFSNHETSRTLKNAPGLSCKACQVESAHYPSRTEERKSFTAMNLLQHFQSYHSAQVASRFGNVQPATHLDWREDMIELPSDRFISGLIHSPGMDDDKLRMIATVFPTLFPTPLPKIGIVPNEGSISPAHSGPTDPRSVAKKIGTSALSTDKSGPSSLASAYTDSPKPPQAGEDEYDPLRPALPPTTNENARLQNRKRTYPESPPPANRRPRYQAEARTYRPEEPMDDNYSRPMEYVEIHPESRFIRNDGHNFEEPSESRALYRSEQVFYDREGREVVYSPTRERVYPYQSGPYSQRPRYYHDDINTEYRLVMEQDSRRPGSPGVYSETSRVQDDARPELRRTDMPSERALGQAIPFVADADADDASRYSPPPMDGSRTGDGTVHGPNFIPVRHTAPSTVSNGSRYEDHRTGRQVPTPDSAAGPRRAGIHRRRERHVDTARYSRFAGPARDEHFARGASISRSKSKRYEQQRRRIDQQEEPQSNADRDTEAPFSRDQSADLGPSGEPHPAPRRAAPREYVSVQDRAYAQPMEEVPRYRGHRGARGSSPMYVNEYGEPVRGYEYIRVPRQGPGPQTSSTAWYYDEYEPEPPVRYVAVPHGYSHGRPPSQRFETGAPREYVYYEERPPPPPLSASSARRSAFEAEAAESAGFEPPPPDIKVEKASVPPVVQPPPPPDGPPPA